MKKLPEKPPSELSVSISLSLKDPEFQKSVSEFASNYSSWDEIQNRIEESGQRKIIWTFIKVLRQIQYEHITFRTLDLKYSVIPEIVRNLQTIDRSLPGSIQTNKKSIQMEHSLIINFLMDEAVSSGILSGADITPEAANEMLRDGRKPKTHAERMVFNNYQALQFMLTRKDIPLSRDLILDVQQIVTKGTVDDSCAGKFRTDNDIVPAESDAGMVYYTPLDYREIGNFIEEFCTFANQEKNRVKGSPGPFIHPVIRGILLLFLLEYYNPFKKGNGRTARIIFYWFMLSSDYRIFEYLSVSSILLKSREKYERSYHTTISDDNDLTYFLLYTTSCIVQALTDTQKFLEQKQTEQNATKAIIKNIDGLNQRQADILREMMEHDEEFYSIRKIMLLYSVVYETARTDLLDLEKRGLLTKLKRGREFLFTF